MKRIGRVIVLSSGAFFLLWAVAWAQQMPRPGAESTPAPNPAKRIKMKKWHGKLVDAKCMVKAINSAAATESSHVGRDFPHFAGSSFQQGRYPGGGVQQPTTPNGPQTGPYPGQPEPNGPMQPPGLNTPTGPTETTRMRRAAVIDHAVKMCPATKSTSKFGLALGDGRVIKFGENGDSKASHAIEEAQLKPGKPVKAIVKGAKLHGGGLQVTSVEIKGKHKK
ncbi:MAG: hypothetical protein M1404_07220 [Acidobacteria bacterium]|nr:hypothetical protein [Acidobacteriota bacterium]